MYTNGVGTGMIRIITANVLSVIQKDQQVEHTEFSAAVPGAATMTTAGLLTATGTTQITGTTSLGFVMFRTCNALYFFPFTFCKI